MALKHELITLLNRELGNGWTEVNITIKRTKMNTDTDFEYNVKE